MKAALSEAGKRGTTYQYFCSIYSQLNFPTFWPLYISHLVPMSKGRDEVQTTVS